MKYGGLFRIEAYNQQYKVANSGPGYYNEVKIRPYLEYDDITHTK